jgi:23S rRNA pseudouridine2605 synthase
VKERIQKLLGNAGVASRRAIEQMVRDGRIAVNGKTVKHLPVLVDPETDRIEVDGERVRIGGPTRKAHGKAGLGGRLYLLMNKPRGVYSTNVAQGEQVRAIDLLPPNLPGRVYPVGRLDAEARGLLLLTNDGDLTNQLTHPRYGVPKTYRATVDGFVQPEAVEELEKGVWTVDPKRGQNVKSARSRVRIVRRARDRSILEITLREDRDRQVRPLLARLGHKVRDLMRVKMGPLDLHGLAPGEVRSLTPREVRELKELPKRRKPAPGAAEEADAFVPPRPAHKPAASRHAMRPHAAPADEGGGDWES